MAWGSTYQQNYIDDPHGVRGGGVTQGPSVWSPGYWNPAYWPQATQQSQQTQAQPFSSFPDLPAMSISPASYNFDNQSSGNAGQNLGIVSKIDANPIYDDKQQKAALGEYDRYAPTGDAVQSSLYGKFASPMRVNTDRMISGANAQQLLASQQARSSSGLGWGRAGMRSNQINNNQQQQDRDKALSLLRALGVL